VSRLLTEMRRQELERTQAAALAAALLETGERITKAPRSAAADPARLRGLPMIGGVGGAVPGTRPGTDAHIRQMDRL
jgi:hypothetical protein